MGQSLSRKRARWLLSDPYTAELPAWLTQLPVLCDQPDYEPAGFPLLRWFCRVDGDQMHSFIHLSSWTTPPPPATTPGSVEDSSEANSSAPPPVRVIRNARRAPAPVVHRESVVVERESSLPLIPQSTGPTGGSETKPLHRMRPCAKGKKKQGNLSLLARPRHANWPGPDGVLVATSGIPSHGAIPRFLASQFLFFFFATGEFFPAFAFP